MNYFKIEIVGETPLNDDEISKCLGFLNAFVEYGMKGECGISYTPIDEPKSMNKLEIAKQIIKENIDDARCGIFNTLNKVGDKMDTLYNEDGLKIDICYSYNYFEVFGLSESEFIDLAEYYSSFFEGEEE